MPNSRKKSTSASRTKPGKKASEQPRQRLESLLRGENGPLPLDPTPLPPDGPNAPIDDATPSSGLEARFDALYEAGGMKAYLMSLYPALTEAEVEAFLDAH